MQYFHPITYAQLLMQTSSDHDWGCNYRLENELSLVAKKQVFQSFTQQKCKKMLVEVFSILLAYTFHFIRYCSKRKNCKIIKLRFLSAFYRLSFIKLSILTGQINQINQWVILPTAKWVSISTAINQLQFIPTHFFRYVHHRVIKMCTNHRVNLLGHTQNFVIACLT